MAHELDFSKGKPAIAYVGVTPWHSFGQQLTDDTPFDFWRTAAGLDYSVLPQAVYAKAPDGSDILLPKHRALVRDDTNDVLSVVSNRFKIVQPNQVIEFFRELIERFGFKMETAGALAGGRRIWALARTGQDFKLLGREDERVETYLMLATAYDGSFATTGSYIGTRVVCNNTIQIGLSEADSAKPGHVFKVTHLQDFNPDEVKVNLGIKGIQEFVKTAEQLSQTRVDRKQAIEFFMELMGHKTDDEEVDSESVYTVRKLLEAYTSAPGQQTGAAKDTAWGLVNAVTYYTDHVRRAKDQAARMDSAWFGGSARLKRDAWNSATKLLEAA